VERANAVFLVSFSIMLCVAGILLGGSIHRRIAPESFGVFLFLLVLLTVIAAIPIIIGIYIWIAAQLENKLIAGDTEPAFMITDDGVSGSIVMLEGLQRSRLRMCRLSRFSLKWDEIGEVRFVPGRRRSSMIKIIPCADRQGEAPYFVIRDNLLGHEQSIVKALQAHGAEVSVEGKLH